MQRTRVKMCGLTRAQDVLAAVAAGADALGFVFYPPSPRAVSAPDAAALLREVAPFVTTVGLFVDPAREDVEAVLAQAPLDLLQFHGNESPAFCASFDRPYIKALRMRDDVDVAQVVREHAACQGILLDSYVPGTPGGTGQVFDWRRVPALGKPVVLAGGLDADNVADAIGAVGPYAVDVSGGIEELDENGSRLPGVKSATAMSAFMRGVTSV